MSEALIDTLPALASPGYPELLGIEPTSVCNLRCEMCGLPARRPASTWAPGPISPEVFQRALEAARSVGLVCVNGAGENFTDPGFLDRLEEMDRRGIRTVFSTNGTLVTPAHAARLASLERLSSVNVSLDSADRALYRVIRGRDQASALRGLAALAAEPGLRPRLTVSAIVWERTLPGLDGLPELLSEHGVPTLVLQGLVPPPGVRAAPVPIVDERLPAAIERLREECGARGIGVRVVPFLSWKARGGDAAIWPMKAPQLVADEQECARRLPPTRQCGAPWEHASIDKDGRVFPCCLSPDRGEEAVLGDLRIQTFDEVWEGEPYRRFRRSLLAGDPPAACRACPATSTGPHFFALYAARLLPEAEPTGPDLLRLAVENAGVAAWTAATRLRIGTTRRRDRPSRLFRDSWIDSHRTGTFLEDAVPAGGRATFAVEVSPAEPLGGETFQLLVEDVCWIPGTEFALERRDGALRARPLRSGLEPPI